MQCLLSMPVATASGKVTCMFLGADPSWGRNPDSMVNRCSAYALLALSACGGTEDQFQFYLVTSYDPSCLFSPQIKNLMVSIKQLSVLFHLLSYLFLPLPSSYPSHILTLPSPCFVSSFSLSSSFFPPSLSCFPFSSHSIWLIGSAQLIIYSKHFAQTHWISQFFGHLKKENADYCP